jgi:hypothetical protein
MSLAAMGSSPAQAIEGEATNSNQMKSTMIAEIVRDLIAIGMFTGSLLLIIATLIGGPL